jgi:hypothetical protein
MKTEKLMKPSESMKRPKPSKKGKPMTLDCVHTPEVPRFGQEVVYTISYTNPNTTQVTSVKIEYNYSSEGYLLEFISATNGGHVLGNKIVWDALGPLGPGESGFVSCTLKAPIVMDPFTSIDWTSDVSIKSAQTSPRSVSRMINVLPWEDLNFVISCPRTVHRGQTFQYVISIINNCTIPVTAIRAPATLFMFSPYFTFIKLCDSTGIPILPDLLGTLFPGESLTIAATVKVNSNAPLGNNIICLDFPLLSDESLGVGVGVSTSVV